MKFTQTTVLAVLAFYVPALGLVSAASIPLVKPNGPVKTDSYIVVLKDGVDVASHIEGIQKKIAARDGTATHEVTHKYDKVLHGYAGIFKGAALQALLASTEVKYVEADGIASIKYEQGEARSLTEEEFDAREARTLKARAGEGVTVYGIDTGVYIEHNTFGGRASWGAVYGGYAQADGNGHGTHTAGTAVGSGFGVATGANLVAIKVLSDAGSGAYSDIISGVNFAFSQFQSTGVPSIATMSLGGPVSSALDDAVSSAISGGLHFTIAAGNSAQDASSTSPADVVPANTIGASDSSNTIASFSNYGSVVDVFAPGVDITSAWIGSPDATNTISGTSMATPFVAGILAVAIAEYGQTDPASLSAQLVSHAQPVVQGVPSGTTNLLATLW